MAARQRQELLFHGSIPGHRGFDVDVHELLAKRLREDLPGQVAVQRNAEQFEGGADRHGTGSAGVAQGLRDAGRVQPDDAGIIRRCPAVRDDKAFPLQVFQVDGQGLFVQGNNAVQVLGVGQRHLLSKAQTGKIMAAADARHQVTHGEHAAAGALDQPFQDACDGVHALAGRAADQQIVHRSLPWPSGSVRNDVLLSYPIRPYRPGNGK